MRIISLLFFTLVVSGCANRATLPSADSVCVRYSGLEGRAQEYAQKNSFGYLKDYGFRPAQQDCDVEVEYVRHGQHHGQSLNPWLIFLPGNPSISESGVVTIKHRGEIVLEDELISVRRATSPTELLDMLAWEVIEPVTEMFNPSPANK